MISDVHEQWHNIKIPECDLLISAGDYSYRGEPRIVAEFHAWLDKQPARHVISCQGNHELWPEQDFEQARYIATKACPRLNFVCDETIIIEGVKIHCSSITPEFHNWAWNVRRGDPIKRHWAKIPDDTEILVTHGPAYGILDTSPLGIARNDPNEHLGCPELLARIANLSKLKLHVFGHIHGSSGILEKDFPNDIIRSQRIVTFVNAAICDERYKPTNPVRIYDLERKLPPEA